MKLENLTPQKIKGFDARALKSLTDDIRQFLITSVQKTGGHLSSNLGMVELTIALHYCFDSPTDKFLWDVGHQAYTHKILTGRYNQFDKLRKKDGLTGFPNPVESVHDHFSTGHASTALSSALGMAVGRDLTGDKNKVIAIFGDGSLTGGITLEAINNTGASQRDVIAILNDNELSISENVGALHSNPAAKKAFFEATGFKYIGPVDGHNLPELITLFNEVKTYNCPVLVHVKTQKGKGHTPAQDEPIKYHGVTATTGAMQVERKKTYSEILGEELTKLAQSNKNIVAITAAMSAGTGLDYFKNALPERFFDMGITEQHSLIFASALAKSGLTPVIGMYSTFLQRAYDQLIHDVCLGNHHVVFCIDRAGLVGEDGETHQGVYDISYLSHIPNMTVMSPKNKEEFIQMLDFAVNRHSGPIAIRYPKDIPSEEMGCAPIKYAQPELINSGEVVALISFGNITQTVNKVYQRLKEDGYNPTFINARFAVPNPLNESLINDLKSKHSYIFTFEENMKSGGFGNLINNDGLDVTYMFGVDKAYIQTASRNELLEICKLDKDSIYEKIKEIIRGEA